MVTRPDERLYSLVMVGKAINIQPQQRLSHHREISRRAYDRLKIGKTEVRMDCTVVSGRP